MAQGRIRKAVEKSIKHGTDSGHIDIARDAAAIGMLRYMADTLDHDDGSTPPLRYVSPSQFLTYCEKLGFLPDLGGETKTATKAQVIKLVGNSKWKKQA